MDHDMTDVKVGDLVLIAVPSGLRGNDPALYESVPVVKVGRVYFQTCFPPLWHLDRKFERKTGLQKSDYMPARAYHDRADYDRAVRRKALEARADKAMNKYRGWRAFASLTDAELEQMIALLDKVGT